MIDERLVDLILSFVDEYRLSEDWTKNYPHERKVILHTKEFNKQLIDAVSEWIFDNIPAPLAGIEVVWKQL